jgi:maltose alpha-D-glucosyltransferase/alpha-amylase
MSARYGEADPLWYKDAIVYELHVRGFYDGDGDGIGDFRGLIEKLDYLEDLGVTAVWILPHYPSPLRDGGYDIADYAGVHPDYGSLRDFKAFLREAHRRGLRVITELVLNHTSDQHRWFRRAIGAAPGSSARNFYVWNDTPDRFQDARIIFSDFEQSNWSWHPTAGAYYWHRFYGHQPDLNFDNPRVRAAVTRVIDFWLGLGVDGLRLDAVPYLFEREGTSCENLPETHAFLKQLRAHIDRRYGDRMLLAEANQWPDEAAAYFGAGDECHMAFQFPLMPRLFMALRIEDSFPILDIESQTPAIPDDCQWALFLRNHDELTLEMVTDEERLYLYRSYARTPEARVNLGIRRRLAPLMRNSRRRIELMNGLLFSLPGTPIVYYGDELGMGDNVYLGDRDGVRTPMQWSPDRNGGFSRADPQRLYLPLVVDPEYHYEAVNAEAQQGNPGSLLWFMKHLIALRKRYRAFGRGSLTFLPTANHRILAFLRCYEDERILVVANLSRFLQVAELDLGEYGDFVPVELVGRTPLRPVSEGGYVLTLGPHSIYWLSLERLVCGDGAPAEPSEALPTLSISDTWESILVGRERARLEAVLPAYLERQRWFASRTRRLLATRVLEVIAVPPRVASVYLTMVRADYADGEPETYLVPIAFAPDDGRQDLAELPAEARIARVREGGPASREGVLYDAIYAPALARMLLDGRVRMLRGAHGTAVPTRPARARRTGGRSPARRLAYVDGTNTLVVEDGRAVLKLYRRLEEGPHPDVEVTTLLTERRFSHAPALVGAWEYRRERGAPVTLAAVHRYIPTDGPLWPLTKAAVADFLDRALAGGGPSEMPMPSTSVLLDLAGEDVPDWAHKLIGPYLDLAHQVGRCTADLHLALANTRGRPEFAPEPVTTFVMRARYQSIRNTIGRLTRRLQGDQARLEASTRVETERLLERLPGALGRLRWMLDRPTAAQRIRCHGNLHLGQFLHRVGALTIVDFAGEPAWPLAERRIKHSPLRDVATLLHSLDIAARNAGRVPQAAESVPSALGKGGADVVRGWTRCWYAWAAARLLNGYLESIASVDGLLPPSRDDRALFLDALMLEKAAQEVNYELAHRPDWVGLAAAVLLDLLDAPPTDTQGCSGHPGSALSDRRLLIFRDPYATRTPADPNP